MVRNGEKLFGVRESCERESAVSCGLEMGGRRGEVAWG